jgi:membrane protein required for colicin V production
VNLFDVSILGIVSFCLVRGIFRGLIKEGVSLIGVIVGFCAASYYFAWIVGQLSNWISNEMYLRILGFLSIFLGIVIIINVLIPAIKYILGLEFIRGVDRSFGGGVGMTKGIIVSSTLLIIFTAFLPKGTSIISDSQLSRYLTPFSEKLVLVAQKKMKHEFF